MRIIVIIHLCLVFTVVSGALMAPFVIDQVEFKIKQILYKQVIENERFEHVEQAPILAGYEFVKRTSGPQLVRMGLDNLLFSSPFKLAWILFSIIIGVLLLKGAPAAREAVWLLPLLVIAALASQKAPGDSFVPRGRGGTFEEYLMADWSKDGSLEDGLFWFNVGRIEAGAFMESPFGRTPLPLAISYVGWNLGVACSPLIRGSSSSRLARLRRHRSPQV